jgi:hypothetical protein
MRLIAIILLLCIIIAQLGTTMEKKITKWEYQWVPSKDKALLDAMGSIGWEAYGVTENLSVDSVRIWMKRPVIDDQQKRTE